MMRLGSNYKLQVSRLERGRLHGAVFLGKKKGQLNLEKFQYIEKERKKVSVTGQPQNVILHKSVFSSQGV